MFYRVSDGLKVNSNKSMDLNDPKEFDDLKGISIVSKKFENTSIFDGLVFIVSRRRRVVNTGSVVYFQTKLSNFQKVKKNSFYDIFNFIFCL